MKKSKFIMLGVSLLALASCKTPTVSQVDINDVGYQYEDSEAPVVREKGLVNYDVIAPKNALADDYKSMKVLQDIYDETYVDITWRNMSETSYATRKNLIMANKNEHPDAIYHAGFTDKDIIQYSSRKVIIPLDPYFDKMPYLSRILAKRPDVRKVLTAPDGHIYSLPKVEEMNLLPYPNLLFLNKVWVESLINSGKIDFLSAADLKDGLDLTLNQYQTILNLFRTNDMNGNGKADELPLSFVYQNWQGNQSDLYATFGIPENVDHMTLINEEVVFTATSDEWRDATNFFSQWVKDGLIDREVFSHTQDAFLAKGKASNQRLGSFYWWESETVVTNPEDYIILNPLIGPNGKQQIGVANNQEITRGEFVVFAKAQNPEILLTHFDRFYNPYWSAQVNYGPKGIVYEEELDANGKLVVKELPPGLTTDELRLKNAPLGLLYLSSDEWENVVNMEPRAVLRLERLDKHALPFVFEGAKPLPNITFTMQEINTLATVASDVNDYVYEQQTLWLLNGGPTAAQFNTFKTTLENIGLSQMISIYQNAYVRFKA